MSEDERPVEAKPELPAVFRELAERAIRKHKRRPATPEVRIAKNEAHWWVGSPYRDEDDDHWTALLFEAFGTRSGAAFTVFIDQLSALCSTTWNEPMKAWYPNENELVAAVQILRSTKPRNEAEACLAAQMVAVHLMQMKLSKDVMKRDWPDPRTCAIAGKLARTYAIQIETMAKLKGKGTRQRITVRKYSKHEHKHIHLHQGGSENGNQPHEPRGTARTEINAIGQHEGGEAMSRPDARGRGLPMPCHQGEEPLPASRRRTTIRSA